MKIRFLFHNPKGERGIGKAIVAWTGFLALWYKWKALKYNFSHMEIWMPCVKGTFEQEYTKESGWSRIKVKQYLGQCFSSTTRGGAEGVRFAPASEVLKHLERWSYIEVEVDDEQWRIVYSTMKKHEGKEYDFLGLFGFLQPLPIQNKNKWFCSEICMWAAKALWLTKKWHKRISPRRAALVLAKLYGEPVKLK